LLTRALDAAAGVLRRGLPHACPVASRAATAAHHTSRCDTASVYALVKYVSVTACGRALRVAPLARAAFRALLRGTYARVAARLAASGDAPGTAANMFCARRGCTTRGIARPHLRTPARWRGIRMTRCV